jgi:hypothetical protein
VGRRQDEEVGTCGSSSWYLERPSNHLLTKWVKEDKHNENRSALQCLR